MLQALLSEIDLYCERTTSAFWAEPVNALTNLAFVIAGLWGVAAVRRHGAGAFAEVLAWWWSQSASVPPCSTHSRTN